MDTILATAIAKELAKVASKGREELSVGTHKVSEIVTLKVEGTVDVSEDQEYTPTVSLPHKAVLALFMRYAGCTGPAAMAALKRAMTEALTMGEDADKLVKESADLEAAEEQVRTMLAKLPAQVRKGQVRVKAKVTALK